MTTMSRCGKEEVKSSRNKTLPSGNATSTRTPVGAELAKSRISPIFALTDRLAFCRERHRFVAVQPPARWDAPFRRLASTHFFNSTATNTTRPTPTISSHALALMGALWKSLFMNGA